MTAPYSCRTDTTRALPPPHSTLFALGQGNAAMRLSVYVGQWIPRMGNFGGTQRINESLPEARR
jgi:hypothetical protein